MKLTFLGDVMCEPTVLKGAKKRDGSYDFNYVFDGVRDYLKASDFIVTNLETPLAGEQHGYTDDFAIFNAPDSYADAVKNAGVGLISTANNHVFDRGYEGLVNTINTLDRVGLPHTGTFLPGSQRQEAYYFTLGEATVAVIAYTYGTNFTASGRQCEASGEWEGTVNLLRPQQESVFLKGHLRAMTKFDKLTKKYLSYYKRCRVKKFFGYPYSYPRADHNLNKETMAPYVARFREDIRKAREKADIVIFYPHTGGQFDPRAGKITEYVVQQAVEAGAHAVVASHAHVVQNAEILDNVPCAYSIGNFNMDPTSCLVVPEYLPGWGLAWHLHVEGKKLKKVTFSILVAQKEKGKLMTRPLMERYAAAGEKERTVLNRYARQIVETVLHKPLEDPLCREEYDFWIAED